MDRRSRSARRNPGQPVSARTASQQRKQRRRALPASGRGFASPKPKRETRSAQRAQRRKALCPGPRPPVLPVRSDARGPRLRNSAAEFSAPLFPRPAGKLKAPSRNAKPAPHSGLSAARRSVQGCARLFCRSARTPGVPDCGTALRPRIFCAPFPGRSAGSVPPFAISSVLPRGAPFPDAPRARGRFCAVPPPHIFGPLVFCVGID